MAITILPESAPPSAPRRPSVSRQMLAIIVAVAVVAVAAVGYLLTRGSAHPAANQPVTAQAPSVPAPKTAAQWLSTAMAAARAQGSVHVEVINKMHGRTGRYSDDDGAGVGIQRISITPGMHAEVRVMPGITFFAANHAALTGYFGFRPADADRAADRWLVLHPGQPGYQQVTEGVTMASTMKQMTVVGPLTLLPARTMHGVRVVGIRGTAGGPTMKGRANTPATLWVTAAGNHLPVIYTASNRKLGSTTTTFSRWGMTVTVVPPTAA